MMDVVVLLRATDLAMKQIAAVTGYRNLSVMDVALFSVHAKRRDLLEGL